MYKNYLIKGLFFSSHSYGFTLKKSLIIDSLQNLESIKRSCESKNLVHTFQRYFSGEYHFHCDCYCKSTNLAAIKFGVSQNKAIYVNLAAIKFGSLRGPSIVRSTYMLAATNISENTQFAKFAKYNSTPKFVDSVFGK